MSAATLHRSLCPLQHAVQVCTICIFTSDEFNSRRERSIMGLRRRRGLRGLCEVWCSRGREEDSTECWRKSHGECGRRQCLWGKQQLERGSHDLRSHDLRRHDFAPVMVLGHRHNWYGRLCTAQGNFMSLLL